MRFKKALVKEYADLVGDEGIVLNEGEITDQLLRAMQRAAAAERAEGAEQPVEMLPGGVTPTISLLEKIADDVWERRKELMAATPENGESNSTVPPLPTPTA